MAIDKFINGTGQRLYMQAKGIIPGGTQLLSKRPELYAPDIWPAYFSKARGCEIWDLDDNKYLDFSTMGLGACILGYADDDVDNAVRTAISNGIASTLNSYEEVKLAEKLKELHPWAEMVRYTRSGGEAMAVAVRIARASTKRDIVLFSGYHGWSDWYLAANIGDTSNLDGQLLPGLEPNGVPRSLKGTAIPFEFENIEKLKQLVEKNKNRIAAIVIEPARGEDASADYLDLLKKTAKECGAVLIFDEITSGFRMCAGGIHRKYGVNPDIAVFAKSMANGYAMAAVIGTESVMQAAQTSFISSTNWTERIGPAAALATIEKYINNSVENHLIKIGNTVKEIWKECAIKHSLNIHISGLPTLAHFDFTEDSSNKIATYFTIRMMELGFLGWKQFKVSFAHNESHTKLYANAVDLVFSDIAAEKHHNLSTPPAHSGFHRLTKE